MLLESGEKIKTCDNYRYLGIRIGKDGRDRTEVSDGIFQTRKAIKDVMAHGGTKT